MKTYVPIFLSEPSVQTVAVKLVGAGKSLDFDATTVIVEADCALFIVFIF